MRVANCAVSVRWLIGLASNGGEHYAVIGRVTIKPGHEQETLAMIESGGVAMVNGFPGSQGGYWARRIAGEDLVQHSFWLFENEEALARQRRRTRHSVNCQTHPQRSSLSRYARWWGGPESDDRVRDPRLRHTRTVSV
jgi:antibiotic biosynthesis monooxygenase (ABM) superfamily enzyme